MTARTHSPAATKAMPPTVLVLGPSLDGLDEDGSFALGDLDVDAGRELEDADDLDLRTTTEHDTGNLYGVQTQQASDTALGASEASDSYAGADRGQNWFEALEVAAIEGGAIPERPIDVEDELTSRSSRKDRPVADAGAGGPAGR